MPIRGVWSKPARVRGRWTVWNTLVPVVALAAGALFAVSAQTARGTDLRAPETVDLASTVRSEINTVGSLGTQLRGIQGLVDSAAAAAGAGDSAVSATRTDVKALAAAFGQTALTGPGLTATLDDAPVDSSQAAQLGLTSTVDLDQLVIHQSDLQAVVNALWVGGAQAVAIAGQRLVPTSAVRCVGSTLLLNGQVYSPPFKVSAIGPSGPMRAALDRSAGVTLLKQAARYYGVVYSVSGSSAEEVPAFDGPITLSYARSG